MMNKHNEEIVSNLRSIWGGAIYRGDGDFGYDYTSIDGIRRQIGQYNQNKGTILYASQGELKEIGIEKETRIIFLDVDGVLNKFADYYTVEIEGTGLKLNKKLIDRLKEVIKDTSADLVLSSSWRNTTDGRSFLEYNGLTFIDETDGERDEADGPNASWRGYQIQRWLDKNPQVDRYIILDDDSDILYDQQQYFIQTDPEYGLTETLAFRATFRLNHGGRYTRNE